MVADGAVEFTLAGALSAGVAALRGDEQLSIAQFAVDGIVLWRVSLDGAGTPQCRYWPVTAWSVLAPDGALSASDMAALFDGTTGNLIVVLPRGREDHSPALSWLVAAFPRAQVCISKMALDYALRLAIAEQPISATYELVVLRQHPSGRLSMDTLPLMPPGARRDHQERFEIRCSARDGYGTVFAVVARHADQMVYHMVSAMSGPVPPGSYAVTAVLRRPGRVDFQFEGQHVRLKTDTRPWSDIVATVPDRIAPDDPGAHLICLIETSGDADEVAMRIGSVRELIERVSEEAGPRLRVSLVSYGSHAFDVLDDPDGDPIFWAWAADWPMALEQLENLKGRDASAVGYIRAAQLECALATVTLRLTGEDGRRPVLVTAGSRPPFPPRASVASQILPCPNRNDWRRDLHRLEEHYGITFGLLTQPTTVTDARSEVWQRLGAHAWLPIGSSDYGGFAAKLALLGGAENSVPFPLYEPERA